MLEMYILEHITNPTTLNHLNVLIIFNVSSYLPVQYLNQSQVYSLSNSSIVWKYKQLKSTSVSIT